MAYGDVAGMTAGSRPQDMRLDWKSALTGGGIVMVVAYVGLVAPAWRQITALQGHVARLAVSVDSLNESRDGVTRATSLLERLEAQAARLAAAEATLDRYESLATRIADQSGPAEMAGVTMDRIDAQPRRWRPSSRGSGNWGRAWPASIRPCRPPRGSPTSR